MIAPRPGAPLALARRLLGPVEVVGERVGEQARLVAVGRDATPLGWVKVHADAGAAAREAAALTAWGPALGGPRDRLIGIDGPVLVLAHVPGQPWRADWPAHVEALTARLAALHALPVTKPDPVPLHVALAARARTALAGVGDVPPEVAEALTAPWPARPRVPAHRDVRPENLVVTDDGEVALLDLGQARPDGAEADVVGLLVEPSTASAGWAVARGTGSVDPALAARRARLYQVATLARRIRRGEPVGSARAVLDLPIGAAWGRMGPEAACASRR